MAKPKVKFMPVHAAEKIAHILGEFSAAALALKEMRERQANGEDVILFEIGKFIVVRPRPTEPARTEK